MITYTPQQADSLDYVAANDGTVLIEAGPGCGKTFIAKRMVSELRPSSGIYTAFNKAIVLEGEKHFSGTPIECKTFHALAWQYVQPKLPIEAFTYKAIKEKITYTEKRKIIDAIDMFFVSASTCMYEYLEERFKDHPRKAFMVDTTAGYIDKMASDEVHPTFNFMLKSLHLMLLEGSVKINVDMVILDEINDVTAVSLEIFRLIRAPKKIGLGEKHQAIYAFLNLVNGFEELKDEAHFMKLTNSYRCSTEIAARIDKAMKEHLCPDFELVGTDKPLKNGLTLHCTLTNASIVDEINNRFSQGKNFTLLRKPADIFAAPLAVLSVSMGKRPYQKQYEYLVDIYEEFQDQSKEKSFFKYLLKELDDVEINNAVKVLMKFKQQGVNLFSLYKDCKDAKPDPKYTISTAFTAKGLEFETVYIADDINAQYTKAITGELKEEERITALRIVHVATSRAGVNLYNSPI